MVQLFIRTSWFLHILCCTRNVELKDIPNTGLGFWFWLLCGWKLKSQVTVKIELRSTLCSVVKAIPVDEKSKFEFYKSSSLTFVCSISIICDVIDEKGCLSRPTPLGEIGKNWLSGEKMKKSYFMFSLLYIRLEIFWSSFIPLKWYYSLYILGKFYK